METYSSALTYFQKALVVYDKNLSQQHPDLAILYHKLSKLYVSTEQYDIAMKYIQQAIEIAEKKLPMTQSFLVDYRETFETIQNKM